MFIKDDLHIKNGNTIMTGGFSNLAALLVVRHSVNQNVFLEEKSIVQTKQKISTTTKRILLLNVFLSIKRYSHLK